MSFPPNFPGWNESSRGLIPNVDSLGARAGGRRQIIPGPLRDRPPLVNHPKVTSSLFWCKGRRLVPITHRGRERKARVTKQLCSRAMKQRDGCRSAQDLVARVNALIRKSKEKIRTCCRSCVCYGTICRGPEITQAASLHTVLCWLMKSRLQMHPAGLPRARQLGGKFPKPGISARLFDAGRAANLIRFAQFQLLTLKNLKSQKRGAGGTPGTKRTSLRRLSLTASKRCSAVGTRPQRLLN